jgi:hypothetical protein
VNTLFSKIKNESKMYYIIYVSSRFERPYIEPKIVSAIKTISLETEVFGTNSSLQFLTPEMYYLNPNHLKIRKPLISQGFLV